MGRRATIVMLMAALMAGLLPAAAGSAEAADTIVVSRHDGQLSNIDMALRLAEVTVDSAETVLIARDDNYADALASGALQADAPLLLLPTAGPVPAAVMDRISSLGADRAVILGGTAAVHSEVDDQLRSAGLAVERLAGGSRVETAVAIAAELPTATTAILARAYPAPDGSATQGFADALAAGGLAAASGWPVLLSDTAGLSDATREYLQASAIQEVVIVGGSAAVGEGVESELAVLVDEVRRLDGANRAATAVAVAEARNGADAGRILVVEGSHADAWAGGFAAAAHSARFDAPIVLATDEFLPPETEAFLAELANSEISSDGITLTCVVSGVVCEMARVARGLPPDPAAPVSPSVLAPGRCEGYGEVQLSADETTAAFVATPTEGCDAVASEPAVVFVDVATGVTRLVELPPPHNSYRTSGPFPLSPDGRLVVIYVWSPGDQADGEVVLVDRDQGTVRPLTSLNESLTEANAGGANAFTADGRLLGRFCGSPGCFTAMDVADGSLSLPGIACWTWWNADPAGMICSGSHAATGPASVVFGGVRQNGDHVEVHVDMATGEVQTIRTGCDAGLDYFSLDAAAATVYRACKLKYHEGGFATVVASTNATGESVRLLQHYEPELSPQIRAGRVDDTGRFLPLMLVNEDAETGRGMIFDVAAGQHVDLGIVRGAPQLAAGAGVAVVATDDGLTRLPVNLPD